MAYTSLDKCQRKRDQVLLTKEYSQAYDAGRDGE